MNFFGKSWDKSLVKSNKDKLRDTIQKEGPLKPKIDSALRQIGIPISKLDSMAVKLQQKDDYIFNKIVNSQKNNDYRTASMYATELGELRKNKKMIDNARLAFEQIRLRLTTLIDLGEAMIVLEPTSVMMNSMSPMLGKMMPDAGNEIDSINQELNGFMSNSIESDFNVDPVSSSMDTELILDETSSVVTYEIESKFPHAPTSRVTENTHNDAEYE